MILRLILLSFCLAISGVSRSELHQVPEGTDAVGMMALVYGGNQAFAAGIDAGLDWAAQKAATLGRTAAEAQELVQTVKKTGEVALTAMALTGLKKGVRAVKAPKPVIIKDALSERAVVKDGKVFLGERELGAAPQHGPQKSRADASNKKPYNPREMEAMLKQSGEEVTSTTLPPKNAPNVKMAGSHKERTLIINAETQETLTQRIVFDERGFPDFRPYMEYETTISGDLGQMSRAQHMSAATRQLATDIKAGKVDGARFDRIQLDKIEDGCRKIPGYTWHHHQDTGRMQLVPEDIHEWVGHVGGNKLWGAKK